MVSFVLSRHVRTCVCVGKVFVCGGNLMLCFHSQIEFYEQALRCCLWFFLGKCVDILHSMFKDFGEFFCSVLVTYSLSGRSQLPECELRFSCPDSF